MDIEVAKEAWKLGGWVLLTAVALLLVIGWALRHTFEKWLDGRFDQRLQNLRTEHDRELRRLQSNIDRELDRARLLNNREFDALRDIWHAAYKAYWLAAQTTSRAQQVHDFTRMSQDQAREFIAKSDLDAWQKAQLEREEEPQARNELYWEWLKWLKLAESRAARLAFLNLAEQASIYVKEPVLDTSLRLHGFIADALTEFELYIPVHRNRNGVRDFTRAEALTREGQPLLDDLQRAVRSRLWDASGATLPPLVAAV